MKVMSRVLSGFLVWGAIGAAAATFAAIGSFGAAWMRGGHAAGGERPDARDPIPLRPGEYRGRPAREFIERGTVSEFSGNGAATPGAIDPD